MQEKTLLFNRFLFSLRIQIRTSISIGVVVSGSAKGVGYEGRDGAESECRKVKYARGEDLWFAGREPRMVRSEDRDQRVDLEVFEGVTPLVEFEPGLLPFGHGFDGWDMGFRWWVGYRIGCVVVRGGVLGGLGRSGEHLYYLFEGGGVSLDEGGRVRVGGFGSGDGFGRLLMLVLVLVLGWRNWRRWGLESIAVGAAGAATV